MVTRIIEINQCRLTKISMIAAIPSDSGSFEIAICYPGMAVMSRLFTVSIRGIAAIQFFGIPYGPNRKSLVSGPTSPTSLPLHSSASTDLKWFRNIQKYHPCRHIAQCRAAAHHSAPFLSSVYLRCVLYPLTSIHKSKQLEILSTDVEVTLKLGIINSYALRICASKYGHGHH